MDGRIEGYRDRKIGRRNEEWVALLNSKHNAERLKIDVLVAIPSVAAHAPDWAFDVEHFKYDLKTDSFTCPAHQILTTNGNWYSKKNGKSVTQMKHYKTSACLSCELFAKCTKNAKGRLIERSEHADLIY